MSLTARADPAPRREVINLAGLGRWLVGLNSLLRPADGWLSVAFLALNLMVVVWSVERAHWMPTPSLVHLVLLAMITGLLLSRIPLWAILVLPVGLVIGALVITWQLSSLQAENLAVANAAELWQRLGHWFQVARAGNINLDKAPFAFALMVLTWLSGYLAAWVFARYRNFWGVFVLGGAGLLSNLTYLPAKASSDLLLYLFTALLLIARVQSVRRRQDWQDRNIQHDGHLWLLSLSDSVFLGVGVLLLAFLLPVRGNFGPANAAYEFMRTPLKSFEGDFNRLFAGLPARRPIPYRIWDDTMAFQGTIQPGTTPVLQVESQTPMYWKARTYGTYTAQGWVSENTVLESIDWVPKHALAQPYRSRFEVTYSVTPRYASRSLFAGGQIIQADKKVRIETYDSPEYILDLADEGAMRALPPKLALAAANLNQGSRASPSTQATALLALGFKRLDSRYEPGRVQPVTLVEVLPAQPDVLSVHSAKGNIRANETYQLTSSVSVATAYELRGAGTDYPTWALVKYTQLPEGLPQRVRVLAAQLTASSQTPYDKAKAIERYLSGLPYSLQVEAPPYQTDGVDHFLFTLRKGYSEYFASAMTVLLRASGVPARVATGYTVGDRVSGEDIYIVNDSHSHAWVEVFFPQYGWITFEPTPGASLPTVTLPGNAGANPASAKPKSPEDDLFDDELDFPFGDPSARGSRSWTDTLRGDWLWGITALVVATLMGGLGWGFWRRYLVPSDQPAVAFRRLASLGALAAVGPAAHQTPFQYRHRLFEVFPGHRDQVSTIVDTYVRHLYGRKGLTSEESDRLVRAWVRLRGPLSLHILQRLRLR